MSTLEKSLTRTGVERLWQHIIARLGDKADRSSLGSLAYQNAETDPTVPAWAKASTKPTYTASDISAGTFSGQVVANASTQTPATSLLRNSKLVSTETSPTNNGEICWTYE